MDNLREGKFMNRKPNIVYFVADQMRCDSMAHMGNPASITPNLDSILEDGISFENAYCQNPVCVPSRCSFLSGLYPHTTGHRTIHYLQNPDEPNFLRTMKNNGYEVIWIGRNDIIPANRSKEPYCDAYFDGFHEEDRKTFIRNEPLYSGVKSGKKIDTTVPGYYSFYVGKKESASPSMMDLDWNCIKSALDYIERKSNEVDSKPFFLYITLTFPHPPYGCEEPWYSSIDRSKLLPRRPSVRNLKDKPSMLKEICEKQNLEEGWNEEQFTELRATYLAMVSRFDHQYGLIKEKLKACDLYDDTSIFVFSDHGDYTTDYGVAEKVQNCFEDPITNIPLLIKPAKRFECMPRKTNALAELVDLTETVCEMTGIKTEYVNFGKSLLNVISGNDTHKEAVFCEGGRVHGETWAMELGHEKESHYWPRLSTQSQEGPQHTKAVMIRMGNYKYVYRLYEKDEFYNLEEDAQELSNQIDNQKYESEINKMKLKILDWFVETGDIVPNRKDVR